MPDKVEIKSSLLNAPEEIDFPRGGGTGLTQVEVREAQLEGENEAMELGLDQDEVRIPSLPLSRLSKTDSVRQEKKRDTEVIKDKGKAKRRKLERALQAQVKEKNILPKDAFRVEHLNYKVSLSHLHRANAVGLGLTRVGPFFCSDSCPEQRSSPRLSKSDLSN